MNIFEYLCREARKISRRSLSMVKNRSSWLESEEDRRRKFAKMLGISEHLSCERPPIKYGVTGVIEREGYRIEKIYFVSLPGLYVTGSLYVPKNRDGSMPAILYLCGHYKNPKYYLQFHGHKFAKLGFVTLIVENIQLGEVKGHHHGPRHRGMFNWYSLGYTPAGVEVWNAIRAIDLLQELPYVDRERIGATGISGGGAISWFVAAIDKRVKAVAPVCATASIESHICKRTLEHHCDCMFWINSYMWDLADVGALIAPRPLLIVSSVRDWIFDVESARLIYNKLKELYEALGVPENIAFVEVQGWHSYHRESVCAVFKWFLKHLGDVDVSSEEVCRFVEEPVEEIPPDMLKVFDKIPPDERVSTVHEWFIEMPKPPKIENPEDLRRYREELIRILKEETFSAFPKEPCSLDIDIEMVQESEKSYGYRISFTPEEGWRLHMQIVRPKNVEGRIPVVVFLARSAKNLIHGDELLNGLKRDYAYAYVETRGIGETSWSPDFQLFIRRAAMLVGRTIASMRIYDAIRALDVIKQLDWVDRDRIALMGSQDMAVVALYTALLRGDIRAVILHDPPPTHNIVSNPDGSDKVVELLNVLRYTDLPIVAGLLWPSQLVFLGPRPSTYSWAEELYRKLGLPGIVIHIKSMAEFEME